MATQQAVPAEVGVGGMIVHPFAEAELERRGNAIVRAELKDQQRVYDPAKERSWQQKYKFFSGQHMKANFRVFARARHDPFNKDPSWGKAVIADVANACARQGKEPADLFRGVDFCGKGSLHRPEVKKALTGIIPNLSDMEIAAIFDTIDQDHSGEVGVAEFSAALERGRREKVPPGVAERWRNPIHRVNRYPPACVDGWDHLEVNAGGPVTLQLDKICEVETEKILSRLGGMLLSTPRALQHANTSAKYDNFGGGADSAKFRRQAWNQERPRTGAPPRAEGGPRRPAEAPSFDFEDPGPSIRPGFMCDMKSRQTATAKGFAALTPRRKPGAPP